MREKRLVVVGGGQAGAEIITHLRGLNHPGEVVLIGEETLLPYSRPPLSKGYLSGAIMDDALLYRPSSHYAKHGVTTLLGARVSAIFPHAKRLTLMDGSSMNYDSLAIATGSRARPLAAHDPWLRGVHYLRSHSDALTLRNAMQQSKAPVIIGGGFIGLECAATMCGQGLRPTVLEQAPYLLARVASPLIAEFCRRLHLSHGVDVRTNVSVARLTGENGHVSEVKLVDGSVIPTDLVLIGIGILPQSDLAQNAGLQCNNGICVDALCRTSDPSIFAAGDCTSMWQSRAQRWERLETVGNAMSQGRIAAAAMLDRTTYPADPPWVWSDQFHVRLQFAGSCAEPEADFIRGDLAGGTFSRFLIRENEVQAIEAVNDASSFMAFIRLLRTGNSVKPEQLTDETTFKLPARGGPYTLSKAAS